MLLKKQVEAILFTTGKFMSAEEIGKFLNVDNSEIVTALEELDRDYSIKDSSLTIQKQDNLFKLNIKKEFGFLTNKLLENKDMDSPTTKTLAIIAYKVPVSQSEVIKIRGNKAYDHITKLKESGLITSEKLGRTRLLKLTNHFYDYFDISEKELKKELKKAMPIDITSIMSVLEGLPKPNGN